MIHSGIAPLDSRLGGLAPGRIHLLAGGIGTGKTTACLHFIAAGLEAGETAAMITLDRPAELRSQTDYLGMRFDAPLRGGRLVLLRFRPGFSQRLARAPSPEPVLEELRRVIGRNVPPARIAIDPMSPFLADGSATGVGLAAVLDLIEDLGSTVLLTWPAPLAPADRRLAPVVERAATVTALAQRDDGDYEMRIARARLTGAPRAPLRFMIRRSVGLVEGPSGKRGGGRVDRVRAGNGGSPS